MRVAGFVRRLVLDKNGGFTNMYRARPTCIIHHRKSYFLKSIIHIRGHVLNESYITKKCTGNVLYVLYSVHFGEEERARDRNLECWGDCIGNFIENTNP